MTFFGGGGRVGDPRQNDKVSCYGTSLSVGESPFWLFHRAMLRWKRQQGGSLKGDLSKGFLRSKSLFCTLNFPPMEGGREREREREIQSDRERARRRGKNDSNTLKIFKAGRVDLFQVSVRFHPGPLEFASAGHPRQNACLDEGKGKQKGKNASIKK